MWGGLILDFSHHISVGAGFILVPRESGDCHFVTVIL
jgi:hypothetical protein